MYPGRKEGNPESRGDNSSDSDLPIPAGRMSVCSRGMNAEQLVCCTCIPCFIPRWAALTLQPGCTACWQSHHREPSISYKLATTTQKNILETDEIMKTEKLQKEGAVSKGTGVCVCLFWFLVLGFFFWRGKVTTDARSSCGGTLKEVAVEKTELSVRSRISRQPHSIKFLQEEKDK